MKFKSTVLLSLFALTAGAARAQVYSSNGVGYVNVTLTPGYNFIANPLLARDNSIGALFANIQGGVPDALSIYKLVNGNFIVASYFEMIGNFEPAEAAAEITLPGDGVWVFLPGSATRVLTFAGEVQQGDICTDIPQGFSIKSNVIPRAETIEHMNIPHSSNDAVYVWNPPTRNFTVYQFSDFAIDTSPTIQVAEAFYLYHTGAPTTWCRTFFLNAPQ